MFTPCWLIKIECHHVECNRFVLERLVRSPDFNDRVNREECGRPTVRSCLFVSASDTNGVRAELPGNSEIRGFRAEEVVDNRPTAQGEKLFSLE